MTDAGEWHFLVYFSKVVIRTKYTAMDQHSTMLPPLKAYWTMIFVVLVGMTPLAVQSQDISIEYIDSMGDSEAGDAPLLAYPQHVDENSRYVYIADRQARTIMVYTHEGEFVRQIGRSGEGPSEFSEITLLYADDEELLVVDGELLRFTRFTPEGENISTHFFHEMQFVGRPNDIVKLENGNYVMVLTNGFYNSPAERFDRFILHELNADLSSVVTSFGERERLFGDHEEYMDISNGEPGYLTVAGDRLLFAPRIYDGKIYVFERGDRGWLAGEVIENGQIASPPFRLLAKGHRHDDANYTSFGSEIRSYRVRNFSNGIHSYGERYAANFVSVEQENDFQFKMEFFDVETGELLSYEEVKEYTQPKDTVNFSLYNIHLSGSGHLYEIRLRPEVVVREHRFIVN